MLAMVPFVNQNEAWIWKLVSDFSYRVFKVTKSIIGCDNLKGFLRFSQLLLLKFHFGGQDYAISSSQLFQDIHFFSLLFTDFDMQNFHILVENDVRQKWFFMLNVTKIDHYLDNFLAFSGQVNG